LITYAGATLGEALTGFPDAVETAEAGLSAVVAEAAEMGGAAVAAAAVGAVAVVAVAAAAVEVAAAAAAAVVAAANRRQGDPRRAHGAARSPLAARPPCRCAAARAGRTRRRPSLLLENIQPNLR